MGSAIKSFFFFPSSFNIRCPKDKLTKRNTVTPPVGIPRTSVVFLGLQGNNSIV